MSRLPLKKVLSLPPDKLPDFELVDRKLAWKTCPKCGNREEVLPAPDLACSGCGRIYAKMEALWRDGDLDTPAR